MKKLLYITTILLSIVVFFSCFDETTDINEHHAEGIRLYEKNEKLNRFMVIIEAEAKRCEIIIEQLYEFSQKDNIEIQIDINSVSEKEETIRDIYLYTKSKTMLENIYFVKDKKGIDFSSKTDRRYYSNDLKDKKAYNHIDYIDKNFAHNDGKNIIRYFPFMNVKEKLKNRQFGVVFYTENVKGTINNIKASPLNQYINTNEIQSTSAKEEVKIAINKSNSYIALLCMAAVSMLLLTFNFIIKKRRVISIQKLFGTSTRVILQKQFLKSLFFCFVVFGIIQFILFFIFSGNLRKVNIVLLRDILFCMLLLFALLMGIYILAFIFIKNTKSIRALKDKSNTNITILYANIILKMSVTIFLIMPFLEIGFQFQNNLKMLIQYQRQEKIMNQYSELAWFRPKDKVHKTMNQILKISEKYGALYEDVLTHKEINEVFPNGNKQSVYPLVAMNYNRFEMQFKKGVFQNKVETSLLSFKNKDVVFIPKKLEKKIDEYTNLNFSDYLVVDSTYKFHQTTYPFLLPIEDPVIHLVQNDSQEIYLTSNTFLIRSDNEKKYKAFHEELKKGGLESVVSFKKLKPIISLAKENTIYQLMQYAILFFMYFVTYISLLYQNICIYFAENKQKISLKYLFGCSYLKRYKEIYFLNLIAYIVPSVISILYFKLPVIEVIKFVGVFSTLEIILEMIYISLFHKKGVINTLKGE